MAVLLDEDLMTPSAEGQAGIRSVFVSYSRADKPRVEGLADLLRGLGLSVFLDQRSIVAGERWRDSLDRALSSCDALVVVWSRQAARSEWVRKEYETAASRRIRLIPVPIDGTPLAPALAELQSANLLPLMNELLALQGQLQAAGASPAEVRARIRERLRQEGIDVHERRLNAILVFTGGTGAGLVSGLLARTAAKLTEGGMTVSGWAALAPISALVAAALLALHGSRGPVLESPLATRVRPSPPSATPAPPSRELEEARRVVVETKRQADQCQTEVQKERAKVTECQRQATPARKRLQQCRRARDCGGGDCVNHVCVARLVPPPPPPAESQPKPKEAPPSSSATNEKVPGKTRLEKASAIRREPAASPTPAPTSVLH
jgi:hypothetical protein